jgi:HEAT repeat protein
VRFAGARVAICVALLGAGAAVAPRAFGANDKPRAQAKGKGKSKDKKPAAVAQKPRLPADRLEALRAAVNGADDGAAVEAAGALGASGASNAADPLTETLATGASPIRTQAALDALAKLGESGLVEADRTVEVLDLYSGHRAPDVRRRAVRALGALREARFSGTVVPVLVARLGDEAPDVRAVAGEALAARRETKAAPRLYALIKRGDPGAAAPLAALATPDMVPQIAELAGTVDEGVLSTALGEYVKRDDVPDKLRVDVLRTIGGLPGAAATTALVEYVASVPAKDTRPSKKEAQKLLDERGSKP